GRQRLENRVEPPDRLVGAADHHAVAALQAPDTAARPYVHVMDLLRREFPGAADVVHVVGVAAVDEDVAGLEMGQEVGAGYVHDGRRDHQPDGPRLVELLHEVLQRGGAHRLLLDQFFHRLGRAVEDHALVACPEKPPHHVGAHPAQADHAELHHKLLYENGLFNALNSVPAWFLAAPAPSRPSKVTPRSFLHGPGLFEDPPPSPKAATDLGHRGLPR